MGDRLDAKHGAFCRVYASGEDLPVADDLPYPSPEYLGLHDHGVTPAAASPEYSSGTSHTIARGPGPTRELTFFSPTNPWLDQSGLVALERESPFNAGMGARFGVTPERPYRSPDVSKRDQDAPGIRRVVRRPFPTLRNRSPKHLPALMSATPSASGQKPRRRSLWSTPPGADFAIPNHRQA